MSEASIPVNLLNPGQVFASLGFLEAAEALFGRAAGGFDWADSGNVRFVLNADVERNPFEGVLEFLSRAEVRRLAPTAYAEAKPKKKSKKQDDDLPEETSSDMERSDVFPAGDSEGTALPVRLVGLGRYLDVTHWADGSSRDSFKLYAGNRSAALIARAMLAGTREKSGKGRPGILKTKGIHALWTEDRVALVERPFDVLTPIGGSFNFDARWLDGTRCGIFAQ